MYIRHTFFQLTYILIHALAGSSTASGYSNKGTEFIFGFIFNSENPLLEIFVTTDNEEDIEVIVELPIYDISFTNNITVRKDIVRKVTVSSELQIHKSGQVDNKGIRVSAMKEIVAYVSNGDTKTADVFLLLPVSVLDKEYYVMSWRGNSAFLIIAIEHDTEINITLSKNSSSVIIDNKSYIPTSTFTIALDKFQTFYLHGNGDFTGTYIISSKPISVISGNTCGNLYSGFCDHMAQQLLPVFKWGYDFVAIGMPNCKALDTFRILSAEWNTSVNITGLTNVKLNQPGDCYTFSVADTEPRMVMSDKPINLVLYPNGGCKIGDIGDPSSIPIAAVSQYSLAGYVFETLELKGVEVINSLAIIIIDNYKNGLIVDGEIMTCLSWKKVMGQNNLVYTDFIITNGNHSIKHVDSSVTFMAYLTGIQFHVSYGYPLGYRFGQPDKVSNVIIRARTSFKTLVHKKDNDCDTIVLFKTETTTQLIQLTEERVTCPSGISIEIIAAVGFGVATLVITIAVQACCLCYGCQRKTNQHLPSQCPKCFQTNPTDIHVATIQYRQNDNEYVNLTLK